MSESLTRTARPVSWYDGAAEKFSTSKSAERAGEFVLLAHVVVMMLVASPLVFLSADAIQGYNLFAFYAVVALAISFGTVGAFLSGVFMRRSIALRKQGL